VISETSGSTGSIDVLPHMRLDEAYKNRTEQLEKMKLKHAQLLHYPMIESRLSEESTMSQARCFAIISKAFRPLM
jgi:hypothetical protein